jgi:hypothetical protein
MRLISIAMAIPIAVRASAIAVALSARTARRPPRCTTAIIAEGPGGQPADGLMFVRRSVASGGPARGKAA